MVELECPHCAAPLRQSVLLPGEPITCDFCGGAFDGGGATSAPAMAVAEAVPLDEPASALAPAAGQIRPAYVTVAMATMLGIGSLVAVVRRSRSPFVAAGLSMLWAGLGQAHHGQVGLGAALAAAQFVALAFLDSVAGLPLCVLLVAYAAVNAFASATAMRKGEPATFDAGLGVAAVVGGLVATVLYLTESVERVNLEAEAECSRSWLAAPVNRDQ